MAKAMKLPLSRVACYTDGGCIGNPGPGGWGAIIVRGGKYRELGGYEPETTNNRMEMTAAIRALEAVTPGEGVELVTDSRYLIDGITKWIKGWKRRGWRKADGGPVLNEDLWRKLDELASKQEVEWRHVRGHTGHPENERCDDIANGFARGVKVELLEGDASAFKSADPAAPETAKKRIKRNTSKSKSGVYLSLVGGELAEHMSWGDCEKRVRGVSGAKFKKVSTPEEHAAALAKWGLKNEG